MFHIFLHKPTMNYIGTPPYIQSQNALSGPGALTTCQRMAEDAAR